MATRRERYLAERLRLHAGLEVAATRRAARLLRSDILTAASDSVDSGQFLLDMGRANERWRRFLVAHYAATGRAFARHTLAGLREPKAAPWLDVLMIWVETWAARKAALIVGTTLQWVRERISAGEAEGLGVEEIARSIRSEADGISRTRALVIARTETHAAAAFASDAAAESTGLELEREWIAADDARTRETHAAADGQRRGMREAFDVGGASLMRPGDPDAPPEETINCRCQLLYDTPAGRG